MLNILKSCATALLRRKASFWLIEGSLLLFFCYVFYMLNSSPAETPENRFMMFEEDYEMQNPAMRPEELMWHVEQRLAEIGSSFLNKETESFITEPEENLDVYSEHGDDKDDESDSFKTVPQENLDVCSEHGVDKENEQFEGLYESMPVLVVQAGRRPARLQLLLAALAQVRNIHTVLLVVSHSFYDEAVNKLVQRVNYCIVLHIYFPYSLQLFPDRFPGPEGNRTRVKAEAAEQKHHWWWTTTFLFQHYTAINPKFSGLALFLKEDDIVAPDLLHMLEFAERAFTYHPEAEVISLGRPMANDADYRMLKVAPWQPPLDSGLAFNKTFWKKLQASVFCQYDDASWSYSLLAAFAARPRGYVDVIATLAPRVVSTRGEVDGFKAAGGARERFSKAGLFPSRVRSTFTATDAGRVAQPEPVPRGVGDWSDPRDRLLCLDPFLMTTVEPPQDYSTTELDESLPT